MTPEVALNHLVSLAERQIAVITRPKSTQGIPTFPTAAPDQAAVTQWIGEAEAAFAMCLPSSHPILAAWNKTLLEVSVSAPTYTSQTIERLRGTMRGAIAVIRLGLTGTFADGIRADTVDEVLDQSAYLLLKTHLIAAVVLGGGALETHLMHLCERYSVTPEGDGSISKYEGALATARNAGVETITGPDSQLVKSWGAMRNKAAHEPLNFTYDRDDVRRMVEGVRSFIARTR